MPDIFLSYSRDDLSTARRFAEAFEREGLTVWWDQTLNPGEAFDEVTEKALLEAKVVVVLWSKKSVASRWVRAEATQAERNKTLFPVMVESCNRPIMFELTHTADLSSWKGNFTDPRWRAFVEGLQRKVGKAADLPGAVAAPPLTSVAVVSRPRARSAITWTAVAVAVVLATGIYWHFYARAANTSAVATVVTSAPASIAILPFRDMSQNKDQEYFADGVTEEILNTLAGLKDLKVTARTSAFAFKGKDVDLRTVGQTLGVQYILEGSIRKDGETLRITAQLIDAKSDAHVWSKTYERPLKDIFKVQDEIARSVAESLQVSLGVGFGKQAGMTRDVEAYDAFLASWPLRLQYTTDTQLRAIALLEQAVARDPNFGEAWVSLAGACGGMSGLVPEKALQNWQQKADIAFANAGRLNPDSLALHLELGERSISHSQWTEAAGHFKNFTAAAAKNGLTGNDPRPRLLLLVGRIHDGLAEFEQNRARDPLNPGVTLFIFAAYSIIGNFPAAMTEFERGYPLDPSWHFSYWILEMASALGTRDHAQILRLMDAQAAINPTAQSYYNAQLKLLLDRPSDALAYLRRQIRDPSTSPVTLSALSHWLAYFGDSKTSLEALRSAYEGGAIVPASMSTWYPVMREVRRLPEFKQLMRDVRMVDYWREYGWGDFCKPVGKDDFECH